MTGKLKEVKLLHDAKDAVNAYGMDDCAKTASKNKCMRKDKTMILNRAWMIEYRYE